MLDGSDRLCLLLPLALTFISPGLSQVDAPEDAEGYIHRVGRTARYNVSSSTALYSSGQIRVAFSRAARGITEIEKEVRVTRDPHSEITPPHPSCSATSASECAMVQ